MLTIRGADQVCTSLRAAQKSLSDGGATPRPRLDELDLMIGELAVGTPGYRGDGVRTKAQIEAFVSLLTKASGSVGDAGKSGELPGIEDAVSSASRPATVTDALGHFRRALATLARFAKTEDSFPP